MDPKVCGKLLTHHQRGYGVDVEALRDRTPLRQIARKGPRWDLTGTEGCGSGKVVSWLSWMFLWYMGIYRRKKYVDGAPWGPRGGVPLPRGSFADFQTCTPSLLGCVCSKKDPREGFVPFGFRLIFLFYETLKLTKEANCTGPSINRLVPKII